LETRRLFEPQLLGRLKRADEPPAEPGD